ncbi:YggS family pyridoxal phosphate-dependent enzyme [Candidatus Woesearchaeota archaeon]|nr:YggS family pyridoxal phosphate-dependent enzyme [Candidatus Woesearchaeota archaeon]
MIKENIEMINKQIAKAAEESGRSFEEIKIVAVTKTATVEQINKAVDAGIKCIGENRVQVAEEKFPKLPSVEKHMIGHLQKNKVKRALDAFDVIQSVDSIKLANEINRRAYDVGRIIPVFIEVNIGNEESKFGTKLTDVPSFYNELIKFPNLRIDGLMTIAPLMEAEKTRPYFREMKVLFDKIKPRWLSMGMSNDYVQAIEEGSNLVRIGRAIFGN